MDPLSVTASIIAVLQLTVKIIDGLKHARDASTDRVQFTTEVQNLRDLLVALLSRVDEDSSDPWHTNVRQMGGKDGVIHQYRVALEQLKDKMSTGEGLKKTVKTVLWTYIQQDAERILLRIERLKSLVHIALEMDHFKISQAIESRVSSLQDDSKTIQVGIETIQQGQYRQNQDHDLQKHYKIMKWLSPDSFAAQQSDLITRKQADTGQWFLDSREFTEWVNGTSQTLFCPGIPGAGKTMMAAITVDYLQNAILTTDIGVAYLYCNYKRQSEQTAPNLVAAIIKQLVQDRPSIAQFLSILYDRHRVRRTRPPLEELLSILKSVLANYSRVYVVLDALDECPERDGTRRQLLRLFRTLQQRIDLRFMATSRQIPEIVEEFKGMPLVEVRASNSDLERFVMGNVNRFAKFVRLNTDLQDLVQNRVVKAADGMFLLASLHVDSLVSKKTTTRLKSALDNLSHGSGALGDAYDKAIDRINGQVHDDCTLAKNVISWISYAQRPLTTEELRHALAVETGDEDFDPENTTDVEDILSVCAGLVTVDEESQVIRLVHYTTQEYLEGIRKDWHPRAQHKIANTCLTYLCFKPFRNGPCSNDDEHESRRKVYSFLDYSARYWPEHLAAVQKEACELAFNLLQDSNLVASALLHERGRYDSYTPRHVTGLHLTAAFGLQHLSKELLSWAKKEKMQLINSKDNTGATPLLWGVQNGRKNIVELLLGTNAVDVDGRNMFRQTPLQCAADHGYKEIVQMLLGTGKVNVNLHGLDGWTALLLAVKRGHKEIVQLLLGTKSVDVNGRNMLGQTPLLCAVRFRHKEIVELLLDTGNVDVNAKDEDEWAALPLAVERGQKEIVELLLGTEKVDVNVKGKDGWTALLLAVKKGHKEIVELLLSTGEVDIDSEVVAYTPLMLAVREGHKEIVEVLLGPGKTDIDKTPARTAPLMYTIDNGYEDLFEFLLGISSSPSKMGDDNPLEALLTANKHRRLAELLLGAGADVHAKDKENSMALMLAGKKGSVNIANLLRSHMSLS